ncbi:hypothetical protein SSPO_010050 [Streptomyces antimycoticus]|uniref:Uncharacterized protein n=1 Tax=Streptomyces antimycoticus TaxID=68175 RepID=A0A499UWL5_9ACTN|nr:hypothetical protein SSPO_010050 [Streptomyces antimycoticus]
MLWLEDGGTTACTDARSRCAPAERFRLELGATVEVDLSREARTDAIGALLAGRVDLVRFRWLLTAGPRRGSSWLTSDLHRAPLNSSAGAVWAVRGGPKLW